MTKEYLPVLLLTGYLGSGKTTLLNYILNNRQGIRFAVIVNDIGEVNIDERLIQKGGVVGQDGDLVALSNGCICCTLSTDLIKQLSQLAQSGKFDYIVIEASGICEPAPIARSIDAIDAMAGDNPGYRIPRLDSIITVVDALRMADEFGCGSALKRDNLGEEDLERLVIEQIEFCNTIIVNKISEVTALQAAELRETIHALNPGAKIIDADYCRVDLGELINTGNYSFEKTATQAAWVQGIEGEAEHQPHQSHQSHNHDHDHDHDHHHAHHHHHEGEGEALEYGISTMVYMRREPFNFEKFERMLSTEWPKNIIRSKGVLYFSQNRDMSLLFETAGHQMKVTEAGLWYATAPAEELEQLRRLDPSINRDWEEPWGDRMDKIVIIGRNLDREAITAMLDGCLER